MVSTEKYTDMIFELDNEFGRRFADFQKLGAELDIMSSPFTTVFEKDLMLCSWNRLIGSVKFQSESIDRLSIC